MASPIISLGTYSGGLLGYVISGSLSRDHKPQIIIKADPAFAYSPHGSCIKSITIKNALLFTGSTDETAKVFDLRSKKELGILSAHAASITAIDAVGVNEKKEVIALTGGDDGSLFLWKGGRELKLLKKLLGHTACIESIAIHSSQRVALTVSGRPENALRLWDLTRGTCAISQKFDEPSLKICWFDGAESTLFAMVFPKKIIIRDVKEATLEKIVFLEGHNNTEEKYTSFCFLNATTFIAGTSNGTVNGYLITMMGSSSDQEGKEEKSTTTLHIKKLFSISTNKQKKEQFSSTTDNNNQGVMRIKGLCRIPALISEFSNALWFVSVNSDGIIDVWFSLNEHEDEDDNGSSVEHLLTIETGARVTCMASTNECFMNNVKS